MYLYFILPLSLVYNIDQKYWSSNVSYFCSVTVFCIRMCNLFPYVEIFYNVSFSTLI